MTTTEYARLSLDEKEKYWLANMAMKSNDDALTMDQWEFESNPCILYQDDVLKINKNYVNEVDICRPDEDHGMTSGWGYFLKADLGQLLEDSKYNGMTIVDYMRGKEFPITFVTWI